MQPVKSINPKDKDDDWRGIHVVHIDLSNSKQIEFALKKYNEKFGDESGYLHLMKPVAMADIIYNALGMPGAYGRQVTILHDLVNATNTTLEEIQKAFPELHSYTKHPLIYPKTLTRRAKAFEDLANAREWDNDTINIRTAEMIYNIRSLNNHSDIPGWTKDNIRKYIKWCIIILSMMQNTTKDHKKLTSILLSEIYKVISADFDAITNISDESDIAKSIVEYINIISTDAEGVMTGINLNGKSFEFGQKKQQEE
jgi:(p)ppGpp synthase/HD superfamily hydrolase